MCNIKIKRFELVEITVNANSTGRINFGNIPQLRNQANQIIQIRDIQIYLDTVYKNSQTTNSVVGFPAAELPKCVLVLYVNGEESVKYIPLAQLNRVNDGTNPYQEQIVNLEDLTNVDFDKSYVQFSSASAATTYVIPFGITYLRYMVNPSGGIIEG